MYYWYRVWFLQLLVSLEEDLPYSFDIFTLPEPLHLQVDLE